MSEQQQGRQLAPIHQVRQDLERMTPEFQMALPAHIPVDKFRRVALTAINSDPTLLQADKKSLFAACMRAAQDGLLPDKQEGALVIFKGSVQWMPMIKGIIKKMRNSGELASIVSHPVYEKDRFTYRLGDDETIEHEPYLGDGSPGKMIAVYAIAKLKDGTVQREVMTRAEVDKVRAVSRSGNNGPWVGWYEEMARKTVVRRLSKYLPMSTDLERMMERDETMRAVDFAAQAAAQTQQIAPSSDPFIAASAGAQIEHQPAEAEYDADTGEVDAGDGWPGPDTAATQS